MCHSWACTIQAKPAEGGQHWGWGGVGDMEAYRRRIGAGGTQGEGKPLGRPNQGVRQWAKTHGLQRPNCLALHGVFSSALVISLAQI